MPAAPVLRLQVLGNFTIGSGGTKMTIGVGLRRLIAFLAVKNKPLSRTQISTALWPDVSRERARANLRSVLWRLQALDTPLVRCVGDELALSCDLTVDLLESLDSARLLLDRSLSVAQLDLHRAMRSNFYDDLLIEWDGEEWLDQERECFRQVRLHCLDRLCDRLVDAGWYGAAIHVGLAAVEADPLRESSHHALIRAHIAEGNRSEALRHYTGFRRLLGAELGLEPPDELSRLVNNHCQCLTSPARLNKQIHDHRATLRTSEPDTDIVHSGH